jgi:glycosyltransferase involved in cell wall biosynthesis
MHIATVRGGPCEEQIDPSSTLHRIASVSNYDPLIAVRIARLIARLRPAIVQTWLPHMDVMGGSAALISGVPWVISEQASALAYPSNWRYSLRHLLGRAASGVVANSHAGAEWWRDRNRRHEFHQVIPNLVSLPPAAEMTRPPRIPAESPRVLFVGRLVEQKRVGILIEALAIVRRSADVKAVICGDGVLAPELHIQAQNLGLADAVDFPGFVMDVRSRLREADVFVSVSAFEGMPNAVGEAMVSGTPVVLSDIPEHREIADEECAVLVDGADPQAVAAGILDTLSAPRRAAARAMRARERVCESSREAATVWSNYYRGIIEAS